MSEMTFLDLPEDMLSIIFLLLKPKDFLSLCSTSKILYSNYHKDPLYWRSETSNTFRTPISPLVKADGARWYALCQRLKTQTRLYTWGQGLKGNLGHGMGFRRGPHIPRPPQPPQRGQARIGGREVQRGPVLVFQRTTSTWPTQAHVPDEVGVIADLQCGGWSTVILSAAGRLYATGSINSANHVNVGAQTDRFERLQYLTQSTSAISSFSAGRTHVMGLTDDGEILNWDRINAKGLKVFSRHGGPMGKPTRVVAGWGESSAYIPDRGIVYWTPLKCDHDNDELDGREVKEKVIPNTARHTLKDGTINDVLAHVVLEGMIVWVSTDSKVWACDLAHRNPEDTEPMTAPVQLPGFFDGQDLVQDVQGSFRRFMVFTASGRVLAADVDYAKRCFEAVQRSARENINGASDAADPATWSNIDDIIASRPTDIPALQNTGVISVRFGDWHYEALHNNGTVTSHGHEPQSCGALGLGEAYEGGKLRGMVTGPRASRQDTNLRPVANIKGRQVWFEPEKRDWLKHLQKSAEENLAQHREETYWNDILNDEHKQTMFSEWIEQEGRHWEEGPTTSQAQLPRAVEKVHIQDHPEAHLGDYFVLAIGAAGWHSGALVLVDEERAEETRQKWLAIESSNKQKEIPAEPQEQRHMPGHFLEASKANEDEGPHYLWEQETFPRIKFPDGTESPAPAEASGNTLANATRSWRDGMPSVQDLGLSVT